MPYDPNNVFAKILRHELPSVVVFEDALTLAFMDIMPAVEGHTLVIPKESAEDIFDLSSEGLAATIRTTQKVAGAGKSVLHCPWLMIVQLNGAAAGQSIPHLHFHILPRVAGPDLNVHGRNRVELTTLELVAAKIRAKL